MRIVFSLLFLLFLAAVPFMVGEFYVNLVTQVLIAAVFAASLNLLVGYGGLTSLGHAAFLGLSAYVCAWTMTKLGVNDISSAVLALLITTIVAAVFGLIALRATGLGFLMITLALSQVLWGLAYRWASVTNGDNGISGIHRPQPFGISLEPTSHFYWMTLIVGVISFLFMAAFARSAFGSALEGTRDQARRMQALGYNVWLIRWITFIYAGFWAAVAGLLYVYYNKYIHPTSLSMTSSAEALLSVIAGGTATLSGPIVGAALLIFLKNYASTFIERWNMLLGFVFVMIVLLMPDGIVPGIHRLFAGRSRKKP